MLLSERLRLLPTIALEFLRLLPETVSERLRLLPETSPLTDCDVAFFLPARDFGRFPLHPIDFPPSFIVSLSVRLSSGGGG